MQVSNFTFHIFHICVPEISTGLISYTVQIICINLAYNPSALQFSLLCLVYKCWISFNQTRFTLRNSSFWVITPCFPFVGCSFGTPCLVGQWESMLGRPTNQTGKLRAETCTLHKSTSHGFVWPYLFYHIAGLINRQLNYNWGLLMLTCYHHGFKTWLLTLSD
jgi:hypothetical protein